jgi:hypothetical protein
MTFLDEDPEVSLEHARFAANIGGRVAITRETYGVVAYRNGDYRAASRELRTAMRISGATDLLPMLADTERGMGRPERALELAASEDAEKLDVSGTIELMIVVAGAYADTGDIETALRTLDIPALRAKVDGRWQVRLWVAYADLLEKAGREDEAHRWLTLAADADTDHETEAAERIGRAVPVPAVPETWYDGESIDVTDSFDQDEAAAAAAEDASRQAHDPAAGEADQADDAAAAGADQADDAAAQADDDRTRPGSSEVEASKALRSELEVADGAGTEAPEEPATDHVASETSDAEAPTSDTSVLSSPVEGGSAR